MNADILPFVFSLNLVIFDSEVELIVFYRKKQQQQHSDPG